MTIRVLVADGTVSNIPWRLRESSASRGFGLLEPATSSETDLRASVTPADAIVAYQAPIPASVIRAAPSLELIQKHGLHCRNIDVAATSEPNVRVATQPFVRGVSVAEHALTLMLPCARKVIPGQHAGERSAAPARWGRLVPFAGNRCTRGAAEHQAFFRRESGRNHQWLTR